MFPEILLFLFFSVIYFDSMARPFEAYENLKEQLGEKQARAVIEYIVALLFSVLRFTGKV